LFVKTCRKSSEQSAILQTAIEQLAVPGIMIGHRPISPGDEDTLLPEEAVALPSAKTRRASGAARVVARELLAGAGFQNCAIPKAPSGAPLWPSQIVGSLAHDSHVAVAAVAPHREFAGIGIDIEPAEALPIELLTSIATPSEQSALATYVYGGRLLFAAKEAVYKAVAGLDQIFLNHHDVEVDFLKRKAVVRNGRTVELRFCMSSHLLALAFVRRVHLAP
jgi:4'-phosphopantetheinyl transferase EntD